MLRPKTMRNLKSVPRVSEHCVVAALRVLALHYAKQTLRLLGTWLAIAWLCPRGFALDPNQSISQLYHTSWTARDGLDGNIEELAQTTDGYLWIGTTDGLFRFDGLSFERYKPAAGSLLTNSVSTLLALSDGGLWIGYLRGGASFLKDGHVTNYSAYSGDTGFPVSTVRHFAQDWDGTIWAAVIGGFARLEGQRWQRIGMNWNYPGKAPTSIFVDNQGTLWVADTGLIMFLPRGEKGFHNTGVHVNFRVDGFAQLPYGDICFLDSTHKVIQTLRPERKRAGGRSPHPTSSSGYVLIDHDGALWVAGQPEGLVRVPFPMSTGSIPVGKIGPGMQTFTEQQGLTSIDSDAILEDREGNIWVGSDGGLDRFRHRNLTWRGLPGHSFSLVAADNGDVWAGTKPGDIIDVRNGKPIKGGPRNIWLAHRDSDGTLWFSATDGLWKYTESKFSKIALPDQVKKASSPSGSKNPIIISAITRDRSGTMWVSISGFGEFQLKDGGWKFIEVVKSHPDWAARGALTDSRNRVWLVYGEVVPVVDHDRIQTFSVREGLTVGLPNTIGGRDEQVWVGGESGLAFLQRDRFHVLKGADRNGFGLITGIVATGNDGLWLAAGQGIIHIPKREVESALKNPGHGVQYDLLDFVSDLPEPLQREGVYSSSVIQGTDGLLWFATRSGVARVDPKQIVRNSLPPPVSIRAVVADDKSYSASAKIALPPLTRSLQIDYTALSLSIPQRVRFRYRLEDLEQDWHDAGTRRQAFYQDLRPGNYQFHVIACNNDGVWNETGSILNFAVAPAWYQTTWFKSLALALALGILFGLYLFERQRYATLLRARFDERLEERTRLARDLHDTLLQTIQGSRLVADHARQNLNDLSQAENALDRLCTWLDRATVEGRAALNSLRSSTTGQEDLASALRRTADICAPDGVQVAISITGVVRSMHPIARDEALRIGEEAVRNACMHSGGTSLAIEARYGTNLTLRVRDNGVGMDPGILGSGKPGHFGIIGMRERASRIGARVAFETSPSKGTSVVLTVPGKVIFTSSIRVWILQIVKRRLLRIDTA
jgi:signal transduction histidine kinase/ligand-binding sensor domain-containing protein